MMNIYHAYLFFSIRFAGGTSDLMFKICKAQEKQGHKPTVISGHYEFDEALAANLKKTKFMIVRSYLDKLGFSIMPSLRSRLDEQKDKIDIVHMHVFRTYQNLILYFFCKRNNIPYVVDAHGAVPYYKNKRGLKKLFDKYWGRRLLQDAAFLIAETEVGVQEYLDVDPTISRSKITVISPPFDTDEFETLPEKGRFRRKYDIDADKKLIMFLGRVHHIKGNDFLIESFAKFCADKEDYLLAIVGSDDGHMDECKTLAADFGISDRVLFTGFIGGHEKNEALIDADLVCQMSRQEQGAWAPFEAVLCGTPIIVSEHTGAGEDVKRVKAGETVPFGDVEDMVATLTNIFDNYAKAKEVTAKAKDYIQLKMSMNARAHEYIDLYENAIKREHDA